LQQPVFENLSSCLIKQETFNEVLLQLETPTRLVSGGKPATSLDFPLLMRAIFRRLGLLDKAHGQLPLELPFQQLLTEAASIQAVETNLAWQEWDRYSSRQRTKLQMGGLVGSVIFRGELQPFLPFHVWER